jgi:hypothetical protein
MLRRDQQEDPKAIQVYGISRVKMMGVRLGYVSTTAERFLCYEDK